MATNNLAFGFHVVMLLLAFILFITGWIVGYADISKEARGGLGATSSIFAAMFLLVYTLGSKHMSTAVLEFGEIFGDKTHSASLQLKQVYDNL